MSKKAVVLGGAGQLGVELVQAFRAHGWDVTSYSRAELDVSDRAAIERAFAQIEPTVVINSAAYNQVDVAEREPAAAMLANGVSVGNLAIACRQSDARLVHFSTDYVFDGTLGRPYCEGDTVHPTGAYAVSKLTGELYAHAYLDRPLIIRTSGVFGPGGLRTARGNFVELMLRLAQGSQPIRVVEDHVASPTYAPALAERTAQMVERNCHGVFHAGGGEAISWFNYARMIFEEAGLAPELHPTNEREYRTVARRPKYSALSNEKMESEGVAPFPPLRDCVKDYFVKRAAMLAKN